LVNKTINFNEIKVSLRRNFGRIMSKEFQLRLYEIATKVGQLLGSEMLNLRRKDEKRWEAQPMGFLRPVSGLH
jgi:hypothetical protein